MLKKIKGFEGYFVDEEGNVYSNKKYVFKKISQWQDSKSRYLLVHIINDDGVPKNVLVHRIVGIAFLPNPAGLPEINHKDDNPKNNFVSNLEWCNRKDNLLQSYKTMSPVRNHKSCELYKNGKLINKFISINAACRYASNTYNASYIFAAKTHMLACGMKAAFLFLDICVE